MVKWLHILTIAAGLGLAAGRPADAASIDLGAVGALGPALPVVHAVLPFEALPAVWDGGDALSGAMPFSMARGARSASFQLAALQGRTLSYSFDAEDEMNGIGTLQVPEPTGLLLMGFGLLGAGFIVRRRR